MSQHLYQCERCTKYGIAHYVLEPTGDPDRPWRNVLVCTACWKAAA